MTALYTLSDFGAVAVMRFNVFTRAIFIQTESYRMDKASLLAVVLIIMTLLLLMNQQMKVLLLQCLLWVVAEWVV